MTFCHRLDSKQLKPPSSVELCMVEGLQFFDTKDFGQIPMESPSLESPGTDREGRICSFEAVSCYISKMM